MAVRHALTALLAIATALLIQAVPAAAASAPPGSPCSASTVSAMNQYCENVPSASGGHSAGPGTPALASQLPPAEVTTLRGGSPGAGAGNPAGTGKPAGSTGPAPSGSSAGATHGARARAASRVRSKLLTLPAPGPRVRIPASTLAHTSDWSLLTAMIGVIAGMTVAGAALAVVARRRRAGAA